MTCQKCNGEFIEIEISHDIPIYMCEGNHKIDRKRVADLRGRHNLCCECHDVYERKIIRKIFKEVFKENILTNDPDRRTLIEYIKRIQELPLVKKWNCQKIAEEVCKDFYDKTI